MRQRPLRVVRGEPGRERQLHRVPELTLQLHHHRPLRGAERVPAQAPRLGQKLAHRGRLLSTAPASASASSASSAISNRSTAATYTPRARNP